MSNPLIQSALKRKTGAKLWGNSGECSQGDSVMDRLEEASSRCLAGLRIGCASGRASPLRAKSVFSASFWRTPAAAFAVSGVQIGIVFGAITQGAWRDHLTGEVPRCLPLPAGVTAGYKLDRKASPTQRWRERRLVRPRLWGCQQSQSSGGSLAGRHERLNRKQPVPSPVTRIVSLATKATTWPAGTSSRQLASSLRNILTGTVALWDRPGTSFQDTHGAVRFQ
jgi:hypothetical protein